MQKTILPNIKQVDNAFVLAIKTVLKQALEQLNVDYLPNIALEHPSQKNFGDYSSNLAMVAYQQFARENRWQSPRELAMAIVEKINLDGNQYLAKVEVAGPGFINFYLQKSALLLILDDILNKNADFNSLKRVDGEEVAVEFAHPNTHKVFHIGHLRNITTGESLARILSAVGYKVWRFNYQGDVGLHIAKCLYGILQTADYQKILDDLSVLSDKMKFIGQSYVIGSKAYQEDALAKEAIHELNYLIYASAQKRQQDLGKPISSTNYLDFIENKDKLPLVYQLWLQTRQWSLDFFNNIYQRVGTHYHRFFFESECLAGVDIAKTALEKGILKESQGAIVFDGSEFALDTRVFVNSLGLPTYEGKELQLAFNQLAEYPQVQKIIHVVAPEQTSFFACTFKVEELLDDKFKDKQYHKRYAFVKLKEGKMSSRTGQVVSGEWLLDEAKNKIKQDFAVDEQLADKIAVGAVKYSFLKVSTQQEIAFDFKESISLEGNSGPYLQYACARIKSLLNKATANGLAVADFSQQDIEFNQYENNLLNAIYQFEEVVIKSALELEPQYIANYLFSLAQIFSSFYNQCPIISLEDKLLASFRLSLAKAVEIILSKGLDLLGIEVVERM